MRLYFIAAAIALLGIPRLPGESQTAPPSTSTPEHNDSPAIVAQLTHTLSAQKLKAGDKVTAKVIQDLLQGGRVVIPRESRLIGQVTQANGVTKTDPHSRLALVFEIAKFKDGSTMALHGVIQALGPPLADPFLESVMSSSSPYNAGENGHPVATAVTNTGGQTNAQTQITSVRPRDSGARALEQRERALETAAQPRAGENGPRGALTMSSRGVFGLPGMFLAGGDSDAPEIIAVGQNVELKSRVQIVLRLMGGTLAPKN
jgi:hypothetical protein